MSTADELNARIQGRFAGVTGVELVSVSPSEVRARLEIRPEHLNTIGSIHAAVLVAIADTSCGAGCIAALPETASGFTTLELKTSFVSAVRSGAITCTARLRHAGSRTQLWEAVIEEEGSGRAVAFFACTELLLSRDGRA